MNLGPRFLRSTFLILALLGLAPAARAQFNSSTVHTETRFSYAGATRTSTGEAVEFGADYEFDGAPYHYYEYSSVYSEGDGTGTVGGSAKLAGVTHTYNDPTPDFEPFDYLADDMFLVGDTSGQSSAPGSNGSANLNSVLEFYLYNYTYDETTDAPAALTFSFNYEYVLDMLLVQDALGGGQANGFYDITAEATFDTGSIAEFQVAQGYFGGPATVSGESGSGQFSFEIPAGNSYVNLTIRTWTNSTTLVPVPEPASLVLAAAGLATVCFVGRRRHHRVA